jgi:DNA polymerase-3 subunit alpha
MKQINLKELENIEDKANQEFIVQGKVLDASHLSMRTGKKWGRFMIADDSGKWEFPLFGKDYELFSSKLIKDNNVSISIKVSKSEWGSDELQIIVMDVEGIM